MLDSHPCRSADLTGPLRDAVATLMPAWNRDSYLHRKLWEWAYITTALDERGLLDVGKRGLGFAVGAEPLPVLFASRGASVLATDQVDGGAWASSGQHAGAGHAIEEAGALFAHLDMRAIPDHLGTFDFIWSACAFEHLGSLDAGCDFVLESCRLLAPGGVAVHTTEFNLTSDTDTLIEGPVVLYRERDLKGLVMDLAAEGFDCSLDLTVDEGPPDDEVAIEATDLPHLRYFVGNYVTTSVGLIITAPEQAQE